MRSTMSAIVLAASLVIISPASTTGAEAPTRSVTLTSAEGQVVSTYPAYAPGLDRFGIRSSLSVSQVSVTASSSEPGAAVIVNGRPVANGSATTVAGLGTGDEISVQITDSSGTTNQSWIVTPPGFPQISTTRQGGGPTAEHVALTLSPANNTTVETILDTNGVPAHVVASPYSHSLQHQPNGHYTVARGDTTDLFSSFGIVEMDEQLRPIREHRMKSVSTTDFHDAVLLPGGGRILMAYVRNPQTGVLESHFEEVNAAEDVTLSWNSADHIDADEDPVTRPLDDNAHLNSIEVMKDGNLLLSFRHLSQVMKVNRTTGAVMWRLGGVRSDFDFPDDPFGGPCAQHTARELANGDIQIFDNGAKLTPMTVDKMCPNPADPGGPRIERGFSRVTVYELDETRWEASLIDSHELDGFSQFAGSSQRLGANTSSDNVMVGLFDGQASGTGAQMPDALEIAPDGTTVWSLSAADASSYRALAVPYRDARKPAVFVEGLADGATYRPDDAVEVRYGCTDQGGSNLVECSATVPYGSRADMRLGPHAVTVTARDGAGNTTTRTINYQVAVPTVPPSPTAADASIRKPGGSWKGAGTTRTARQTITLRTTGPGRVVAHVKVRNSGDTRGRLALTGSRGNRWSTVRWFAGKRDVTPRVVAGTYRTAALDGGESVRLRLVVRASDTDKRRTRTLRLAASSRAGQGKDVVRARLIVR